MDSDAEKILAKRVSLPFSGDTSLGLSAAVLQLIAEDKTSKEIGDELFVSHRTVDTHRLNISRKLNLRGNLALVKFAITHKSEL